MTPSLLSILLLLTSCSAYVFTSSSSSSFIGKQLVSTPSTSTANMLTMKKGKPNVPANMRGQYKQQQQMNEMKEEMAKQRKVGPDGFPIFNLFVRTNQGAKIWYPCGSFKGDERSKALCDSYGSNPFLGGLAKKQLDAGVSNSIYDSLRQLTEGATRQYPQLNKQRDNLEWGYRLVANDLSAEQKEMNVIVPQKRETGVVANLKNLFS